MSCDLASVKLDSYFDEDLSAGEKAAVARHVSACADCAEILSQMQAMRSALAGDFAGVVPPGLEAGVKAALAREVAPAGIVQNVRDLPLRSFLGSWSAAGLARAAAVFVVVAGVSAGVTYDWVARHAPVDQITHDIVAAHARAMMEATPYQVASSDQHTVKPWFAGRTEFSPEVRDFADHGYALVGGRLDYINGQRVAALVYKHGAHFIDVFMWPNAGPEADPHYSTSGGYQLASWVNDGIEGRCISDIGPAEMKIFASLLYGKEG